MNEDITDGGTFWGQNANGGSYWKSLFSGAFYSAQGIFSAKINADAQTSIAKSNAQAISGVVKFVAVIAAVLAVLKAFRIF